LPRRQVGQDWRVDAITLLRDDHKTVEGLFRKFEKLGSRAAKGKRDVVDKMIRELSVHAAIEEQVFYPAVRDVSEEIDETVLESLEEHHIVKWTLSELQDLDPDHERFDPKVKVLIESVRHHVEEEESELFPEVRKAMGRKHLQELGEALKEAKKTAPTRPHPRAPDEPPANLAAGAAASLADRARDAGRRVATRGRRSST
jgi:hemerythrin superfamily protein